MKKESIDLSSIELKHSEWQKMIEDLRKDGFKIGYYEISTRRCFNELLGRLKGLKIVILAGHFDGDGILLSRMNPVSENGVIYIPYKVEESLMLNEEFFESLLSILADKSRVIFEVCWHKGDRGEEGIKRIEKAIFKRNDELE